MFNADLLRFVLRCVLRVAIRTTHFKLLLPSYCLPSYHIIMLEAGFSSTLMVMWAIGFRIG